MNTKSILAIAAFAAVAATGTVALRHRDLVLPA